MENVDIWARRIWMEKTDEAMKEILDNKDGAYTEEEVLAVWRVYAHHGGKLTLAMPTKKS